jgi:hypothetical protein
MEMMRKLQCMDIQQIETQPHARETGQCRLVGHRVTIAVFDNDQARDEWVTMSQPLGEYFAVGSRWAAYTDDLNVSQFIAATLRGTPRSRAPSPSG